MIRRAISLFLLLSLAGAAGAQTPDTVLIRIPDGNSHLQSTDLSGTLASAEFSCTWSISGNSAVFGFDGPFESINFYYPRIEISWSGVTEPMPLHLEVVSAGTGTCSFAGDYEDPALGLLNLSYEDQRVGDWELGQQFPACNEVLLDFALDSPSVPYDLELTLQWGPGVATDPASWDGIKSLYR